MRILHINNLANVSVELREAQKRQGHEVVVVRTYPNHLNYDEDWRLYDIPGPLGRLGYRATLMSLIRWADVVHAHGGLWHRGLGLYTKLLRKTFIVHYHGSDIRHGPRHCERFADLILLATPDLTRLCPRGVYVPDPVTPLRGLVPHSGFRVVHAHADAKDASGIKGSKVIRDTVASIPGVEYVEVTGLDHARALDLYRTADLAVDQLRIGWYGVFALECMSMGVPTVGLVQDFGEFNPVMPVTEETLREVVLRLADDPGERLRVALCQSQFVRRHHDPDKVAEFIGTLVCACRIKRWSRFCGDCAKLLTRGEIRRVRAGKKDCRGYHGTSPPRSHVL